MTEFKEADLRLLTFIKPVYAGDRLTVHGVVKEMRSEDGATRVVVNVWCGNQDGEQTAVASASGRLLEERR